MSSNIIGVDVSKATLDIFELNGQTHQSLPNSHQGIRQLVMQMAKTDGAHVVFEATGRYHKELERALARQDIVYTKVNPWQARRFAEAAGKRAKTDKVDAQMLAQMGQALQLNPTVARDELIEILGEFESLRLALVQQRTASKNRLQILSTKAFQRLVERQIEQLEQDLEGLVSDALAEVQRHPELAERFDILVSIPGIGATTALSLLIAMPELGTLSEKQAGALAGLAPIDRQSGNWTGKARIRGGRANVRQALYMPALVASRYNEDLVAFYNRLVDAGKPKKVTVTAVMRKILIIANALVRENRKWQPKVAG